MVDAGQHPAEVAKQLGISEKTLNNWRRAAAAGIFESVLKQGMMDQVAYAKFREALQETRMTLNRVASGQGI